jgi:hypothetical protein
VNGEIQVAENTTTFRSEEETHYLNVFFFAGSTVSEQKTFWLKEKEALTMFQRGVNKYNSYKIPILLNLRDKDHNLVKSELLNYKEKEGDLN